MFCSDKVQLSKEDNGEEWIVGYAAVFHDGTEDTEYELMEGLRTKFTPKSFEGVKFNEVLASYDHDYAQLLGRYPDTLKLDLTSRGLLYKIKFNANDPDHQKVKAKIEGGYLKGSSLTFYTKYVNFSEGKNYDTAEYQVVSLEEVGPVANPAFKGTSAVMLSKDSAESTQNQLKEFKAAKATSARIAKLEEILKGKA